MKDKDKDSYGKSSRENCTRRKSVTKKDVMTDPIMKKGHTHLKEHKASRTNNKTMLRGLDIETAEDFDEFYLRDIE